VAVVLHRTPKGKVHEKSFKILLLLEIAKITIAKIEIAKN
jgi:hypothetical protein